MLPLVLNIRKVARRDKHFVAHLLRLSLRSVRAAFIAAPKALKSYCGTGLFDIIIHPVTFYCSPFFLDMFTQFYQLVKIIPTDAIPSFGMVKIG